MTYHKSQKNQKNNMLISKFGGYQWNKYKIKISLKQTNTTHWA